MKLRPEQLSQHLNQTLLPVYLVHGDEPLLIEEGLDALRKKAQTEGFSQRQSLFVEKGFDWQQLLLLTENLSLFSEKEIIELRLDAQKPTKEASDIIQQVIPLLSPDKCLFITANKLDARSLKAAWITALEKAGGLITVWPITPAQLPKWIEQRARALQLTLTPSAVQLIAERTQGNLLAAKQALEKLVLLFGEGTLADDEVQQAVGDSARYNPFELVDACLAGKAQHCHKILAGLQAEGTEAPWILGALARELRQLAKLAQQLSTGKSFQAVCQEYRVFHYRQALTKQALTRRPRPNQWWTLLKQASRIDATSKGFSAGNTWEQLQRLCLNIAGHPILRGVAE